MSHEVLVSEILWKPLLLVMNVLILKRLFLKLLIIHRFKMLTLPSLSPLFSFCLSPQCQSIPSQDRVLNLNNFPPFPLPTNTHTHTIVHTYSPQQCQGGTISLLPALTSPASSPQALEGCALWALSFWPPIGPPWNRRSLVLHSTRGHEPHSQVNYKKKNKPNARKLFHTRLDLTFSNTYRDTRLQKQSVCQ